MEFSTENFLINNAVLYLSKYILLNNNFESFSVNGFNQNLNQLYYNKKYFCNALDYFIKNDFLENIVFKVETISDDKINEIFINKDSKNYELPDGKIILKTQKYFNDYLNENIYYYPSITFNKINKNKLIDFINEYLNLWLDNNLKLDNKMFYKKEKQLELVVGYIKELLSEYNSKNLLINLDRLYNSTYVVNGIGIGKIEDYQVDVLITLIYLETKEFIKIKDFKLGYSFESMYIIVDIDEEKIGLNNFEIIENTKKNIIKDFLIKIEKFKKLASKGLLKINDEKNLINELKSYNFGKLGEIITDEILFLTIEKLQTPPNLTQWTPRKRIDEPIYTNIVSNNLLEWENLFKETIQENGIISSNNNQEILLEDNIVKIYDDIIYYKDKYLFKNPKNLKEFPIKSHGNYDKMMDLLLKNNEGFVYFEDFKELEVYNKSDTRTPIKRITDTKDNLIKGVLKNLEIGNFTKIPNEYKFIIVKNKSLKIAL